MRTARVIVVVVCVCECVCVCVCVCVCDHSFWYYTQLEVYITKDAIVLSVRFAAILKRRFLKIVLFES